MLDLLVKYYIVAYKILKFWKLFGEGHDDATVISIKINQFSKYRIDSKIFGSNISFWYVKSSYILAKFITSLIADSSMNENEKWGYAK